MTKGISGKKDSPVELLSAYGRGNFKDNTLCVRGASIFVGMGTSVLPIMPRMLYRRQYCCLHFTDEETETQRDESAC